MSTSPIQVAQITITALPITRTDGSAIGPSDIGVATFYKGTTVAFTTTAAATVGTAYTDTVQAVDGDSWTVTITDTQTPPVQGVASSAYVVSGVQAPPEAQLSAPTISGAIVAAPSA